MINHEKDRVAWTLRDWLKLVSATPSQFNRWPYRFSPYAIWIGNFIYIVESPKDWIFRMTRLPSSPFYVHPKGRGQDNFEKTVLLSKEILKVTKELSKIDTRSNEAR